MGPFFWYNAIFFSHLSCLLGHSYPNFFLNIKNAFFKYLIIIISCSVDGLTKVQKELSLKEVTIFKL